MTDLSLGMRARATLLALLVLGSEASNGELKEFADMALTGRDRVRLNEEKLVESYKVGRSFHHRLTPKGREWCEAEASTPCPDPRTPAGRLAYVLLNAIGRHTERTGTPIEQILALSPIEDDGQDGRSPADRVFEAYQQLKSPASRWVSLRRLRAALPDLPRAELDRLLRDLARRQEIVLVPEHNVKVLAAEDQAAAIEIGGEDKHAIAVVS